jgi:hypothetical protein
VNRVSLGKAATRTRARTLAALRLACERSKAELGYRIIDHSTEQIANSILNEIGEYETIWADLQTKSAAQTLSKLDGFFMELDLAVVLFWDLVRMCELRKKYNHPVLWDSIAATPDTGKVLLENLLLSLANTLIAMRRLLVDGLRAYPGRASDPWKPRRSARADRLLG